MKIYIDTISKYENIYCDYIQHENIKNDRRSSGGTLPQKQYLTFIQWTNRPMDQRTSGPMDQWTNRPMDQYTNGHSTFSCDINCIDTVIRLRVTLVTSIALID